MVIGAGVVGLAIARALALAGRDVLVLEAERSLGTATSSRNSAGGPTGVRSAAAQSRAVNATPPAAWRAAGAPNHRTASATPTRSALALGLVGSLGEELLAVLVAASEYRAVHVGVTQMIGSAAQRFRPWLVGHGTPVVDDAFIAVTGEETFVPMASPIRRYGEAELLDAARVARDAGATTLVVVAPLSALLQMGDATRTLASIDEIALVKLGFVRLVFVRPTLADDPRRLPSLLRNLARTVGRTLADLMLPSYARALSARAAARAIVEGLRSAGPGVTVLGAKELAAIVQQRLPELAPKKRRLR